ncbi:MAG: serine--tRNA ligase [Patescibacteria group bacterium]
MIDIKLIRENPEVVQKGARNKGFDIDIKHILEIDDQCRKLSLSVQKLREERNAAARDKDIEKGKKVKEELDVKEKELKSKEEDLQKLLLGIPNLPAKDVKAGKDESENEVIRTNGDPTKFAFSPKDHLELGEALDIIDVKRAAKVSGTRFAYLKNEAVLLEFALAQLAFEVLTKEGFIPVVPPALIKQEITEGLGYWHAGGNEDYYLVQDFDVEKGVESLKQNPLYLIGTSEHAIVPMHKDEVFNKKDLPKRYVGFSSAFRREAGSYGKDTRGIFRVHQFDKVEMVSFVSQEDDEKELDYLLSLEEKLFQMIEIPYQVVKMCTGDLGFPAAKKYDLEAWIPSQNRYREITSVSTVTDFQARRLNIKYQEGNEKKYTHILNGTAFSTNRPIIAILENYQQVDGSVSVPKVLQKYVGKSVIKSQK